MSDGQRRLGENRVHRAARWLNANCRAAYVIGNVPDCPGFDPAASFPWLADAARQVGMELLAVRAARQAEHGPRGNSPEVVHCLILSVRKELTSADLDLALRGSGFRRLQHLEGGECGGSEWRGASRRARRGASPLRGGRINRRRGRCRL